MSLGIPADLPEELSPAGPSQCGSGRMRLGVLGRLRRHVPPGQLGRFLLVGVWNSVFGYGTFAAFTAVLQPLIPYSYMAATIIASLLNITVAFLGYKWFVFHTKGHYLREYLRSMTVYLPSLFLNAVAIAPLTAICRSFHPIRNQAPYIAGALLTGIPVILSFFGHKHVSFKRHEPI